MKVTHILQGWKAILVGRTPFLSVELTKECPLSCPGCYAYNDEHLGGNVLLTQVSDFKGKELIDRFMQLVDRHMPLHISIVGGEPLVRFRELNEILPQIAARKIPIQLVTSAVRPIPPDWANIKGLVIVVSIDGLPAEHDVRRKPATYERILKNIEGHQITIHCTITRQMTERPGYLREFMDFWSPRPEIHKVWFSLFTPQVGETSYEILPPEARINVVKELHAMRLIYPKISMTKMTVDGFLDPPSKPSDCIFAKTTRTITADLKTRVGPCQFGGNPDCSQCGCMASAGLNSVARVKLAGAIPLGWIYDQSLRIGSVVAAMRGDV
jgi:sulfatase maturation enzyme AslB (radical SAM superfamily)